jgi:ectoine hydroxylase-related dioxygenase (phytanoyl-CoA dioxygenase family)
MAEALGSRISTRQLTDEQIADYHRDGFLVVRKMFETDELAPLGEAYHDDPTVHGSIYGMEDKKGKAHPFNTWTELNDDIIGMIPRMARMVEGSEALLGECCYHWHSKFSVKTSTCDARVDWHQDYASWYDDGVLFPHMLTVGIAIEPTTRANGCVQFVPGSHHMGRIGTISLRADSAHEEDQMIRFEIAKQKLSIRHIEMDVGDAVFFHCNTLHGSGLNTTDSERVMIFCSYNAASNAPHIEARGPNDEGAYMNITAEERAYRPLAKIADDVLVKRRYKSVFSHTRFQEANYELDDTFCQALKIENF